MRPSEIFCRFCGAENNRKAIFCKNCGKRIKPKGKGLAITSLVLGTIGVATYWLEGIGIIPAILAFIFGLIACSKRVARGMAIIGLALGIIGMVSSGYIIYSIETQQSKGRPLSRQKTPYQTPYQTYESSHLAGKEKGIKYSKTPALRKKESLDIDYSIEQKILLPVLCNLLPGKEEQGVGIVHWKIKNNWATPVNLRLSVEVEGWSDLAVRPILIKSGGTADIYQFPTFKDKLMENTRLCSATLRLKVEDQDENEILFVETKTIHIAAKGDMVWGKLGGDSNKLIAAWVTYNDPEVLKVLSLAKEDRWWGRINVSGYQGDVYKQMRGIFFALEKLGISYVSTPRGSVETNQKINLPRESIRQKRANCIDGAVLYASLFEAINLDPVIVLVPGHAFVGVRASPNSNQCYFLETTRTGAEWDYITRAVRWLETGGYDAFDRAYQFGNDEFIYYTKLGQIQIIDIKECRNLGIRPMR